MSSQAKAARLVVLLRGINVGGRGKLAMAELRKICSTLGCTNVSTYIQSGNVVLDSTLAPDELIAQLGRAIEEAAGFRPHIVIRTADQLDRALKSNPYPDAEPRYLHIGFLSASPTPAAVDEVSRVGCAPERFTILGTEIYLDYVAGAGASKKLARVPFERVLDVAVTARNLRTVRRLAEMANG